MTYQSMLVDDQSCDSGTLNVYSLAVVGEHHRVLTDFPVS